MRPTMVIHSEMSSVHVTGAMMAVVISDERNDACCSEQQHSTLGQKSWKCCVWQRIQSSQIISFPLENTLFLFIDALSHSSPVANCLHFCFVITSLMDFRKHAHFEKLAKHTSPETTECWTLIAFTTNQGKHHILKSSPLTLWRNIALFLWFSHPFSKMKLQKMAAIIWKRGEFG